MRRRGWGIAGRSCQNESARPYMPALTMAPLRPSDHCPDYFRCNLLPQPCLSRPTMVLVPKKRTF